MDSRTSCVARHKKNDDSNFEKCVMVLRKAGHCGEKSNGVQVKSLEYEGVTSMSQLPVGVAASYQWFVYQHDLFRYRRVLGV